MSDRWYWHPRCRPAFGEPTQRSCKDVDQFHSLGEGPRGFVVSLGESGEGPATYDERCRVALAENLPEATIAVKTSISLTSHWPTKTWRMKAYPTMLGRTSIRRRSDSPLTLCMPFGESSTTAAVILSTGVQCDVSKCHRYTSTIF